MAETRAAIDASGAEIVTIAVRRTNLGQNKDEPNILEVLPPSEFTYLPQHRRLLRCQDRGTHLPSGTRAARWPQPGQTGGAG